MYFTAKAPCDFVSLTPQPRSETIPLEKHLLRLFLLTAPMGAFGIALGSYPLSIPAIVGVFLALSYWLAIFGNKILLAQERTLAILIFVGWMAICSSVSSQWMSFLSLGTFLFASSIIAVESPTNLRFAEVFRWIHYGGAVAIFLVLIELSLLVAGMPTMQDFLSGGIPFADRETGAIVRVRSGFQEPSYFAIYLAILLVSLDLHGARYLPDWQRPLALTYGGALLFTLSLTGLTMIIGYWVAKRIVAQVNPARSIIELIGILTIAVAMLMLIGDQHWLVSRLLSMPDVVGMIVEGGQTTGSVATRLMAITMPAQLWSTGLKEVLFGLGFNSYESWVVNNYYFHDFGINEGRIHNILAVFGLGGGVFGLVSGLFLFWVCSGRGAARLRIPIFTVLLAFAFGSGSITSYLFWWVLFVASTIGCELNARRIVEPYSSNSASKPSTLSQSKTRGVSDPA